MNLNKKELILRSGIIFVGLWIITTLYTSFLNQQMADYSYSGFPLKYSQGGGLQPDGIASISFSLINLIIDIVLHLATAIAMALLSFKIRNKLIVYLILSTPIILLALLILIMNL